MTYVILLLAILLLGVILVVIGGGLLYLQKNKWVGFIILGIGLLMTLVSILGFLSIVITTRTMG
jgi:hypothetical protein